GAEPGRDRVVAAQRPADPLQGGGDPPAGGLVAEHDVHLVPVDVDLHLAGGLLLRGQVGGPGQPTLVELGGEHLDVHPDGRQRVRGGTALRAGQRLQQVVAADRGAGGELLGDRQRLRGGRGVGTARGRGRR